MTALATLVCALPCQMGQVIVHFTTGDSLSALLPEEAHAEVNTDGIKHPREQTLL